MIVSLPPPPPQMIVSLPPPPPPQMIVSLPPPPPKKKAYKGAFLEFQLQMTQPFLNFVPGCQILIGLNLSHFIDTDCLSFWNYKWLHTLRIYVR